MSIVVYISRGGDPVAADPADQERNVLNPFHHPLTAASDLAAANHPSRAGAVGQARSDVTYSCSSPASANPESSPTPAKPVAPSGSEKSKS